MLFKIESGEYSEKDFIENIANAIKIKLKFNQLGISLVLMSDMVAAITIKNIANSSIMSSITIFKLSNL